MKHRAQDQVLVNTYLENLKLTMLALSFAAVALTMVSNAFAAGDKKASGKTVVRKPNASVCEDTSPNQWMSSEKGVSFNSIIDMKDGSRRFSYMVYCSTEEMAANFKRFEPGSEYLYELPTVNEKGEKSLEQGTGTIDDCGCMRLSVQSTEPAAAIKVEVKDPFLLKAAGGSIISRYITVYSPPEYLK